MLTTNLTTQTFWDKWQVSQEGPINKLKRVVIRMIVVN